MTGTRTSTTRRSPTPHGAVVGKACLWCHEPHESSFPALLKTTDASLCFECHERGSLSTRVDAHRAERGSCLDCHNGHLAYPETFYAPFKLDDYALCFTCHDKQLVLQPKTTGLTRFRNGDDNLHFVHVNRPDKGRSCRACHATHASTHEAHVRDSVPYGKWELPINFTPTATGGSCAPGCHKEAPYDREKAIQRPTLPGPSPAKPVEAAKG